MSIPTTVILTMLAVWLLLDALAEPPGSRRWVKALAVVACVVAVWYERASYVVTEEETENGPVDEEGPHAQL